jgi:hypothetical protein
MLEAQTLQHIGQLDVDAEIVGVELELIPSNNGAFSSTSMSSVATSPSTDSFQWR